jgi:hypothetical protein
MTEFDNKIIYTPLDYTGYMINNNNKTGDIAAYNGYINAKSPFDVISITDEERVALTAGYNISFGDPNDTTIDEADDFYVKATKGGDSVTFDFIGFGNFQDYETVKVVLHDTNDTDCKNWAINKTDVSFLFNRDKCIIRTNTTDFFALNLIISSGTECVNKPIYTRYENYFTFKITIPFSQLGNIPNATSVEAIFLEMDYIGNVYNGGQIIGAVRYQGVAAGDPALQSSYVPLF